MVFVMGLETFCSMVFVMGLETFCSMVFVMGLARVLYSPNCFINAY
jgi:hypothetical protein